MKSHYIDQFGIDSLPHLKEAVKIGCKIFVTLNKGLIKDRMELEKKFKLKIRTPGEIVEEGRIHNNKRENPAGST